MIALTGKARDRRCAVCGYGVAAGKRPDRCPMCGGGSWQPSPIRPAG